jgi:TPR repeat protein
MPAFSKSRAQAKVETGDRKLAATVMVPAAFFSYSREDSEFVLHVARDLKAAQADVWLDQMDIVPGQRWDDAVERALADCPRMLVVLSPAAVHSTNVMDEVSFALEEGKTVIPILYRDCGIPFRLRRVQYIDFRRDYEHGLTELLKILAAQHRNTEGVAPDSGSQEENHGDLREAEDNREPTEPQSQTGALESPPIPPAKMPSGPGTSPTTRAGPSGKSSAPPAPPLNMPRSIETEHEDTGEATSKTSMKTKAAAGACGLLIAAAVLFWGLRPSPAKPETLNPPVVQPAAANPAASTVASPSAQREGNSGSEVSSPVKTEAESVTDSIGPAPSQPEGAPPKKAIAATVPRPHAVEEKTPSSSASRGSTPAAPADPILANLYHRAEAGDTHAMVDLGMRYVYGRGVPKDYPRAVSWLRFAANAGDATAMNNLGVMYANGFGVPKDYQQAVSRYRKAAEAGYVPAMANLGSMYEKGNGFAKDSQQAVRWYQRAAQAGSISAMYDLGAMYESGEGVGKDRQQAVAWYRKAAVLGEPHAKDSLNRLGVTP